MPNSFYLQPSPRPFRDYSDADGGRVYQRTPDGEGWPNEFAGGKPSRIMAVQLVQCARQHQFGFLLQGEDLAQVFAGGFQFIFVLLLRLAVGRHLCLQLLVGSFI